MNKDNDLIHRLNKIADSWDNSGYPIDAETVREAITALSPVLPEELQQWINLLADFDRAYGKDKRYGELADLIERLARELALIKVRDAAQVKHIEELEGIIKAQNENALARIEEAKQAEAQITEYDQLCERFAALVPGATNNPEFMAAITELERIRRMK